MGPCSHSVATTMLSMPTQECMIQAAGTACFLLSGSISVLNGISVRLMPVKWFDTGRHRVPVYNTVYESLIVPSELRERWV